MTVTPQFPHAPRDSGMYESFFLRAVSPNEPVGAWIRYTVHKPPKEPAQGSLWLSVFDARAGAPFTEKHTSAELAAPAGGWIEIGESSRFGPGVAEGVCGPARWSLRFSSDEPELRHFKQALLYRAPLPRTKLTSPAPAASFDGTIELPDRTLRLSGWRGMVGHNWGSEHAARWIWLHGVGFQEDPTAWLDVALGRVLIAGRLSPWVANGAISLGGQRLRLGGLGARGVRVAESAERCSLSIPGEDGLALQAHVDTPPGSAARWRYMDPGAHNPTQQTAAGRGGSARGLSTGEHDVVNCSVAALALNVRRRDEAAHTLHTAHGAAYELGVS
jgi:hypothetical protein